MFKSFDLTNFGKYIRKLRKSIGYTQKEVEEISGVTADALRRIEKGTVMPRFDTLIYLSQTYKLDLINVLKSYGSASDLISYYHRLDNLIINHDIETLKHLESDFASCVEEDDSTYQLVLVSTKKQFEYILSGISQFYCNDLPHSLADFIAAMQISHPTFNVSIFKSLKYTVFESRILLCISLVLSAQQQYQLCDDMLHLCMQVVEDNVSAPFNDKLIQVRIYKGLSLNYHRMGEHYNALEFANKGIDYCNKNHISYCLGSLFYRKAMAEYLTNQPEYLNSLKSAINILTIQNRRELAEEYKELAQTEFGIQL